MAKKKGKAKKKKKETSTKKKKQPTEKELFEIQVEKLKEELETTTVRLREINAEKLNAENLLEEQVGRKESCVLYLKKELKREFGKRLAEQSRLQVERDLAEVVESRAAAHLTNTQRCGSAARALFLQQKMELESKLSHLEELRLARNSQRAQLKRVEDTLEERESSLRDRKREADLAQVDTLLKNREEFMRMCADTATEFKSAFDLQRTVYAKEKLEENLWLRSECATATENLLSEQEDLRAMKGQLKAMFLAKEIRESAEQYAAERSVRLEKFIQRLEQDIENGLEPQTSPWANKLRIAGKKKTIRSNELELWSLEDRTEDAKNILEDQSRYKKSLERDIAKHINLNGVLASAILRAGKIFQTRCDRVSPAGADIEMLRQMSILLNLAEQV